MKMKANIALVGALGVALLINGCGSSDNNTEETSDRFKIVEKMGDMVEQDSQSNLEWIGSAGNGACSPNGAAESEEADVAAAQAHCDALTFAGHDDWRVSTPQEHADHIQGMMAAGMTPFYQNAGCPRLIGVDVNGNAQAVNTHNSDPVGGMTPWSTLLMQDPSNFGIKCVRDF